MTLLILDIGALMILISRHTSGLPKQVYLQKAGGKSHDPLHQAPISPPCIGALTQA